MSARRASTPYITNGNPAIITTRASRDDAIHVYTLTIAYLHNARIGSFIPVSTLHVKEKWEASSTFGAEGTLLYKMSPLFQPS